MNLEYKKYLHDILTAANKIEYFIENTPLEKYQSSDLVKSAVERKFEIIGEALSKLLKHEPKFKNEIPNARDIISFRNLLIHGYTEIDDKLVYNIATTRLTDLKNKIEQLLKQP